LVLSIVDQQKNHSKKLIMDFGCSYHICPHRSWFVTYEKKSSRNVLMDNNDPCKTIGIGSMQIKMDDGIVRTLTNIHYVPKLMKNLVFLGAMGSKGFTCCVEGGVVQIKGKEKYVVMQGTKQENLYILQGSIVTCSVSTISQAESHVSNNNSLWHMCLGHMREKGNGNFGKQGLHGNHKVEHLQFCEHCVYEKQHKVKFPKVVHTIKATLDCILYDCWGPSRVPSLGRAKYFLSIIDNYSR